MTGQTGEHKLSTRDVAKQLGVHLNTVARWADEGKLPFVQTPGGWRRFRPEDVDIFAASLHREAS